MEYLQLYRKCTLCPRACKVDRTNIAGTTGLGYCREKDVVRVAHVGPHFGEEPPFVGENGSGTVFFSGCTLRCSFCQNFQISHMGVGTPFEIGDLLQKITDMITSRKVHNINFVTPDHFFPHVFSMVARLKEMGTVIPILYNLSGYQSLDMLKISDDFSDIYLPDFKYSDSNLAQILSGCPDYPHISIQAIEEMIKQKGFLDEGAQKETVAKKGVLVRHLILPGHIQNSLDALSMLFIEFGSQLPISLMSQYYPVKGIKNGLEDRPITLEEFQRVYDHCIGLGFESLFVQFPDNQVQNGKRMPPFLPDFTLDEPFSQSEIF